jgi:hypothetical protein
MADTDTERPVSTDAVAQKLGVSRSHLLNAAITAGIKNFCGRFRAWFSRDIEAVRPYAIKRPRFKHSSKAAKRNMGNWLK